MKNLKTILSVFALAAVFSANAFAQGQTGTVNATAVVQSSYTLAQVTPLDFGTILTTDDPTIAAADADAGVLRITGAASGVQMNVVVTFPTVLTDGITPANDLTFDTYEAAYSTTGTNDATASTSLGTASGQTVSGSFTSTANDMHVYVGGQISDASAGVAGNTYNNDITVQVSYN